MLNVYHKKISHKGYFKFDLLYPVFVLSTSKTLHHGKISTKEISFITKISLTGNNQYVKFILSIFGFGIQIEIKE
jgi:hypothetical protein